MKKLPIRVIKHVVKVVGYGAVGALIVLIAVFVVALERRPDLAVWHETLLDEEFTDESSIDSLEGYLELEDRLFAELDEQIYDRIEPSQELVFNRYYRGSRSDPERWPQNWNRTFVLRHEAPVAGVLLLHGMSDSPYSLRGPGEQLHEHGATVIGLRIPGHGTAPSGLVHVRWQDMAAAVELAMQELSKSVPDRPLYIVGYSNGGALAVEYAISVLEDASLPRADGLVLISPAIGVTPMATYAVWQARLGWLLGLKKLAWHSIIPEYDPYKYGSFAVNAGDQSYRLATEIQSRLTTAGKAGMLDRFPDVLTFQSIADATVSSPALVRGLFQRLPEGRHELVLFDINRITDIEALLFSDPRTPIDTLINQQTHHFSISLVTNVHEASTAVVVRQWLAGESEYTDTPLGMTWPEGVYSLSHVALPFAPDDPLYGIEQSPESPSIKIGQARLRGERGLIQIPAADMVRLRWNPFHDYLEQRLLDFTGLDSSGQTEGP